MTLMTIAIAAGWILATIGAFAFRFAHRLTVKGDLAAARAAYAAARRTVWPGLAILAVVIPVSTFVTAYDGVPMAVIAMNVVMPLVMLGLIAFMLFAAGVKLQNALRPPASGDSPVEESIAYELTSDHLRRACGQWYRRSAMGRALVGLLVVGVLAVLVLFPLSWYSVDPGRLVKSIVHSIAIVAVAILIFALFGRKMVIASAARQPGVLGQHTIEVRADGLRETTSANDTLWPWAEVREIVETREFLLLRIRAVGMFMIPRSAFTSDDQLRRFIDAVRRRMSARGEASPTPS